jgi:molecular chaperone GrpE
MAAEPRDELTGAPAAGRGEAVDGAASPASPATQAGEAEAPVGPPLPQHPPAAPAAPGAGEGADRVPAEGLAPGEEPATGHEPLELDLEELAARARKADEYLELAQRTRADFENFRKRAARDTAAAQERGVARVVRELLPAIDNLDRALAAIQDTLDEGVGNGIKLVQSDLVAALQRVGVEAFSPEGEPFDPTHHEAVAQQPVDGKTPGTVAEVYQRGYRLGESILRPARVLVAG